MKDEIHSTNYTPGPDLENIKQVIDRELYKTDEHKFSGFGAGDNLITNATAKAVEHIEKHPLDKSDFGTLERTIAKNLAAENVKFDGALDNSENLSPKSISTTIKKVATALIKV